jgi:hypothetical protein
MSLARNPATYDRQKIDAAKRQERVQTLGRRARPLFDPSFGKSRTCPDKRERRIAFAVEAMVRLTDEEFPEAMDRITEARAVRASKGDLT